MLSISLRISYCTNLMPFSFSLSTYMHRDRNFCSLRCGSKTSYDFFLLHPNFIDRFVLTVDLSKL